LCSGDGPSGLFRFLSFALIFCLVVECRPAGLFEHKPSGVIRIIVIGFKLRPHGGIFTLVLRWDGLVSCPSLVGLVVFAVEYIQNYLLHVVVLLRRMHFSPYCVNFIAFFMSHLNVGPLVVAGQSPPGRLHFAPTAAGPVGSNSRFPRREYPPFLERSGAAFIREVVT
jgi:hypothetical protein